MSLPTGEYIIVNKSSGLALDGNAEGANQLSHQHKRPFMWSRTDSSPNHKWIVEKQSNGNYLLKTKANNQERALDGNTGVPQHTPSHPHPFLFTPVPSAPNHRWSLQPVYGEQNTFVIVNESNGLALDGNTDGIGHYDHNHKAPFLWTPVHTAPNHHWVFHPVAPLQSGRYMIVNKQTGQALDGNVGAPSHLSHQHKRPFVWQATPSAENHYWNVKQISGNEYMLTTNASGPEQALDGNTSVPQHTPSHPQPFLFTPVPSAPNHRWKLIAVPYEPNTFYIVNAQNNLGLDGNVAAISHYDHRHQAPFLYAHTPSALNHKWEFRAQTNQSSGSSVGSFIANAFNVVSSAIQNANQQQQQQQQYQQQPQYQQPSVYQVPQQQNIYQVPQQPFQPPHQPTVNVTPNLPYPSQPNVYQVPQQQNIYQVPQQPFQPPHVHQPHVHVHQPPHVHVNPHVHIQHHQPHVQPHVQSHQQPQFTSGAMDYNAFQQFLANLKKEPFESGRKNLITSIAQYNFFSCDQLSQLFKALSFSSEKLHAAHAIVPRIVDKQNSHICISSLTFSSEKDEVSKLFQNSRLY